MYTLVKLGIRQPIPTAARSQYSAARTQTGKELGLPEILPSKEEARSWLKKLKAYSPDHRYAVVPLKL